jgi:ribosomal protein S17E
MEKIQENIISHETIKNSIADYILENFKTRNSNEKKQAIIEMVDTLSFQERNQILDYISDQARSISEYQNCDDQSQLLYLLKDLNAEE